MPRMNNHVKLIFALEHVAHLEDLIEGNEWEQYLSQNLSTMKYEFERQLSLEEDKLNVTTKRKNWDGKSQNKRTGTSYQTLGKTKMITKEKQRAQVKSKFYYIFWAVATFSVVAGQLYVGSGYRQMSRSFNRIMDAIVVEIQKDFGYNRERFY